DERLEGAVAVLCRQELNESGDRGGGLACRECRGKCVHYFRTNPRRASCPSARRADICCGRRRLPSAGFNSALRGRDRVRRRLREPGRICLGPAERTRPAKVLEVEN